MSVSHLSTLIKE